MSELPKTRFDRNQTSAEDASFGAGYWYVTPPNKRAQAEYEAAYGHPTDINKVWAHRELLAAREATK